MNLLDLSASLDPVDESLSLLPSLLSPALPALHSPRLRLPCLLLCRQPVSARPLSRPRSRPVAACRSLSGPGSGSTAAPSPPLPSLPCPGRPRPGPTGLKAAARSPEPGCPGALSAPRPPLGCPRASFPLHRWPLVPYVCLSVCLPVSPCHLLHAFAFPISCMFCIHLNRWPAGSLQVVRAPDHRLTPPPSLSPHLPLDEHPHEEPRQQVNAN